jgi:hypothetical protein
MKENLNLEKVHKHNKIEEFLKGFEGNQESI